MLSLGNIGQPANCGPAGGGGIGLGVGVGGTRTGLGVGVANGDGVTPTAEAEVDGLDGTDGCDGDAFAVRSLVRPCTPDDPARRASRLEPAIVKANPMITAHRRRPMSEAYGGIAAVAPHGISQSRNRPAASRARRPHPDLWRATQDRADFWMRMVTTTSG
jgi:hypothetical protein